MLLDGAQQGSQAIAYNDTVGVTITFALTVTAGQALDFASDAGGDDEFYASTAFSAVITTDLLDPEPELAPLALLTLLLGGPLARARRARPRAAPPAAGTASS